jgi:hypothetical protein
MFISLIDSFKPTTLPVISALGRCCRCADEASKPAAFVVGAICIRTAGLDLRNWRFCLSFFLAGASLGPCGLCDRTGPPKF